MKVVFNILHLGASTLGALRGRAATFALGASLVTALAVGCYSGNMGVQAAPEKNRNHNTAAKDLPCAVSKLLDQHCVSCHDGNSSIPILSRADLLAPSLEDPDRTIVDVAIERMRPGHEKPMPPTTEMSDEDIAVFENWLADELPAGECGVTVSTEFDTPSVCTSETYWTRGDHESPRMYPGRACIACHTKEREGPRFTVAGTVFPTAHEPDDCNGVAGPGPRVVITDAKGRTFTIPVNDVGNFGLELQSEDDEDGDDDAKGEEEEDDDDDEGVTKTRIAVAFPYTAKVVSDGRERAMVTPQKDGDCNGCHTETGTNVAPGRIVAP